ncbi:MAG TPA: chorismate synthase, partial [Rhodospirillaceae bacterium]|nr:chorismate synthase [Rhodospirillaceae bacterium]
SARETAMRVAAGGVARKVLRHILGDESTLRAALVQMGPHQIDRDRWVWDEVDNNP